MADQIYFSQVGTPDRWDPMPFFTVRKARIGWWVDGHWCPTKKIRDHEINCLAAANACGVAAYHLRESAVRIRRG